MCRSLSKSFRPTRNTKLKTPHTKCRLLMHRSFIIAAVVLHSFCGSIHAADPPSIVGAIKVQPDTITLSHRRHPHSILVTAALADGRAIDLTAQATYTSANQTIAKVSSLG